MGMMSGLPKANPTVLKTRGEVKEGLNTTKWQRGRTWALAAQSTWGYMPAVDYTVKLHRIVLPALGHCAHVLVDASQHGHMAGSAFSRHTSVAHSPRTFLSGFSDEKGRAGFALCIHFEKTVSAAAVGAEDHDAFRRTRNVGNYRRHAMNNRRSEVATQALKKRQK